MADAKAETKAKKREGKHEAGVQHYLPGIRPPKRYDDLDRLAARHRASRKDAVDATEEQGRVEGQILDLMRKRRLEVYRVDGEILTRRSLERLKVKQEKGA